VAFEQLKRVKIDYSPRLQTIDILVNFDPDRKLKGPLKTGLICPNCQTGNLPNNGAPSSFFWKRMPAINEENSQI
jgi:hypothetical protein